MYKCTDCEREFEYVEVVFEKHGLNSPPFERIKLCPFCKSTSFIALPDSHCRNCGFRLRGKKEYCSEKCRKEAELLFKKEEERRIKRISSPIARAIAEVTEYNKNHGTALTYGQYFALKGTEII